MFNDSDEWRIADDGQANPNVLGPLYSFHNTRDRIYAEHTPEPTTYVPREKPVAKVHPGALLKTTESSSFIFRR